MGMGMGIKGRGVLGRVLYLEVFCFEGGRLGGDYKDESDNSC